jgi:Flp pilus assembly pilin Flp
MTDAMTGFAIPETFAHGLRRFLADERGTTATEYAIVAAGVAVTVAATIVNLGTEVKTALYDKLASLF